MGARCHNKTRALLVLAALFLLAGLLLNPRLSTRLIARYLSDDGTLEAGTVAFLREFQVGLLATCIALAVLGLTNAAMARRPSHGRASPLARRLSLAAILTLAAYLLYLSPYYAMRLLNEDPTKYAVSAYNLFTGMGYSLTLNHQHYPPDMLIGYPLCIIPFYLLFGPFLGNAIFATFTCALLALGATYAFSRNLFGSKAALLTTLLVSSNWLFIDLGRQVRSDMLTCLLMMLAVLVFLAIMKRESGWLPGSFLLGLILGFSYTVRPPNLVMIGVVPPAFLIRTGPRRAATNTAMLILGMALVLIPFMAFCDATYGGPMRTGYHVWLPELFEGTPFISPRNIALNRPHRFSPPQPQNVVQRIERYLRTTNGAFYSSALLGLNRIYNPAVFIFIVIGVAGSLGGRDVAGKERKMLSLCLIAAVGLSILFYMMMQFNLYRYLLPVLPLILAFAGFGMSRKIVFSYQERVRLPALFYLILLSIAMSGVGLSLYRRATTTPPPPLQYEICTAYRELAPHDACIISGVDAVLVDHLVLRGSRRAFYALSENSFFVGRRLRLRPGDELTTLPVIPAARRLDDIRGLIDAGKVVMMDDWESPFHPGRYREALETMSRHFVLEEVARKGPFGIYRLSNPAAARPEPEEPAG